MTAEGPGNGIIFIFCFKHSLIKIAPGSEIPGVPASEMRETILLVLSKSALFYIFEMLLCAIISIPT